MSEVKPLSKKSADWVCFTANVTQHIEEYVVPQYGDKGTDEATEYTAEECAGHIKRYATRFGKNSRGNEEQLRDLIKIAHYAQLAYDKLKEEINNEKD